MLKIALQTLALLNTLLGAALAAAGVKEQFPSEAIAVGLAVFFQGAYTLLYPVALQPRRRDVFRLLFVGGHGAAALVGGLTFLSTLLSNLHPRNGDVELAPMAMGFFLFVLAATALFYDSQTESPMIRSS
ncbi:MAG TPA: hypothetical protein VGP80_05960 [Gemmatimonadales bacterium]|nr:hypothetical protein [Gemmatimonadales bacterium]